MSQSRWFRHLIRMSPGQSISGMSCQDQTQDTLKRFNLSAGMDGCKDRLCFVGHASNGPINSPSVLPPLALSSQTFIHNQGQMCLTELYTSARFLTVYNYEAWILLLKALLPPCQTSFSSWMVAFLSQPARHRDSLATALALFLCFIHIFPYDPIFPGLGSIKTWSTKTIFHRA